LVVSTLLSRVLTSQIKYHSKQHLSRDYFII